jgi:hypothetical protein
MNALLIRDALIPLKGMGLAAAGSSLTATIVHDADSLTLLRKIQLVLALHRLSQALVVIARFVLVAHPVGRPVFRRY